MSAFAQPIVALSFRRHGRRLHTPNPKRLCGLAWLIATPVQEVNPRSLATPATRRSPRPDFRNALDNVAGLAEWGHTVWLGFIRRALISSAELQESHELVDPGVRSVTSNPSVPEQAIGASADYDRELLALVAAGRSVDAINESLVQDNIYAQARRCNLSCSGWSAVRFYPWPIPGVTRAETLTWRVQRLLAQLLPLACSNTPCNRSIDIPDSFS